MDALKIKPAKNNPARPCFCYVLECSDGTFYTGWSTDLQVRLDRHNQGKGGKYTRSRLPVRLVYFESLPDRSSAMRRECQIKKLKRDEKETLVGRFQREE